MIDDHTTDLFIEISKNLGEINSKMTSLCKIIESHENRIVALEQNVAVKICNSEESFKKNIIQLLVKGLIVSICSIASLTGAGSILKHIFGA